VSGAWYSEPDAGAVVDASNGWDAYQVWMFGRKMECECATWRTLRRPCKHMDLLKESIRAGKPVPGVVSYFVNETK
jgi:hypothetical protein